MKNCGVAYADGCKIYLSPWVSTKGLVVNFVISEILRWRSEWHLFSLSFWGTVVTKNLIAIMRFFALLRMTFPKPPFTQGGLLDLLFCRPDCKVRSHRRGRRFPTACFEILRFAQNDTKGCHPEWIRRVSLHFLQLKLPFGNQKAQTIGLHPLIAPQPEGWEGF